MKIAKKDTEEFENGPTCKGRKYSIPSEKLSFVTAKIEGRYPEKGKVFNEVSDEIYYVMSGSCTIYYQGGNDPIEMGDVFFFPAGKWWYVDQAEQLSLVVCCAPPWKPEQHKSLD